MQYLSWLLCSRVTRSLGVYNIAHIWYYNNKVALCLISLFLSERKECSSAIMKNSKFNEQQKDKWLSIITNDMMSSEESGPDDSIIVHPLPWRSQHVDNMFEKVDRYNDHPRLVDR